MGCGVQEGGARVAVVGGRVVLGVVITVVVSPRAPVDKELALAGPVLDPIESHVDGFGAFLFDGVIGKSLGSRVINLHGGGWLRMTHFLESGVNGNGFLAIDVCSANCSFGGGTHDVAHNSRNGEERTI
jgi:hypothetical protein